MPDEARADRVARKLINCKISVSTAVLFRTSSVTPQAIKLALRSLTTDILYKAILKVREAIQDSVMHGLEGSWTPYDGMQIAENYQAFNLDIGKD
ncbi:hypothetical protein ACI1HF_000018 [Escherichia coli]